MLSTIVLVVNKNKNTTINDSRRKGDIEILRYLDIKINTPKTRTKISFSEKEKLGSEGSLSILIYKQQFVTRN